MTDYGNGTKLEYDAKRDLEENGYFVIRSAGSHGPVDLVGWKMDQMVIVQCKRSSPYLEPAARDVLIGLAAMLPGCNITPLSAYYHKEGRAKRTVRYLTVQPRADARTWPRWTPDYGLVGEIR